MSRFLTLGKRIAQSLHQKQVSNTHTGGLKYGQNQASTIYSGGLKYGWFSGTGLYSSNSRLYSHYGLRITRLPLSSLFGARNQLCIGVKRFSAASKGKIMAKGSQITWKRLYKRSSCGTPSSLPTKRFAQAVGLNFGRFYGSRPSSFKWSGARNQFLGKTFAQQVQLAWKFFYRKYSSNTRTSLPITRIAQSVSIALSRSSVIIPGLFAIACGRNVAVAQAQAHPDVDFIQQRKSIHLHAREGHVMFVSFVTSLWQGIVLLLRALHLVFLFSPCIVMAPFADSFGSKYRKIWLQLVHQTLERAGPAFIKWGQWAASRPDLFPRDLCAELSKLHTKAPEHSFAYTKKTIEKAFGRKITEIFEDFEEAPVASGSIAQVHRATLKYRYHGRQIKPMVVAVKVRHPGVGESIKRDFEIINVVAKLSKFIPALNWLRLDESVQQFAVFMMSQVDLAREAAHLSRFIYNFRSWKNVSFPKPVYPLVHPAVLVETFEQGECVSHYVDELQGHERLKSTLAHIGTHALLKMLLVDNFIHADMHPGNILVREGQSKASRKRRLFKSKPHVIFLDVGMTAELSKSDRSNLVEFFKAVARRDGQTAAECALRLSKIQNCPNPKAFIAEVKESFDFWGTPEGDLVHPADCMQQLLEQVRRHRVNIDGNVCTVMVTTLVLEGWQRKLDPDYDVMHTLQTILLKADWAKSLSYTIEGLMAP